MIHFPLPWWTLFREGRGRGGGGTRSMAGPRVPRLGGRGGGKRHKIVMRFAPSGRLERESKRGGPLGEEIYFYFSSFFLFFLEKGDRKKKPLMEESLYPPFPS